MPFGKKQVKENRWLDEDELEERLTQRFNDSSGSDSSSTLMTVLGGGAVVAIAFGATFFFLDMAPSNTAAQSPGPVIISSDESKPIARTYTHDPDFPEIEPDATKVAFTMVVTETGFDAIDSELHEQCMRPVDADMARRAEATGKVLMEPEQGGQYVACTMKIYKNRFCQPFYKDRLVNRLTEFVRVQKTLQSNLDHNFDVVNEELMQYGMKMLEEQKQKLPPPVPSPLATQIYELSALGIVSLDDFGWTSGASKILKGYFAEPTEQACG